MDIVEGFSRIEYLVILISIVYGFSIVELFSNWARMIRLNVYYWETIVWSIITFLTIANMWYIIWYDLSLLSKGFPVYFLILLLPPIGLFFIIALLFPDKRKENWELKAYFLKNRKKLFTVMTTLALTVLILGNVLDLVVTIEQNIFRTILTLLLLANIFINSIIFRTITVSITFLWYLYVMLLFGS